MRTAILLHALVALGSAGCLDTDSLSRCTDDPSPCSADASISGDPCADPVPTGNLTTNPSFETDLDGWTTNVPRMRVEAGDCWGVRLEVTAPIEVDYLSISDSPDSVSSCVAGSYQARAYVKAGAPASLGKTIRVVVRERLNNEGPNYDQWESDDIPLSDDYQVAEVAGPCQVPGHWMDVYVFQQNAEVGDAIIVDNFTLIGP